MKRRLLYGSGIVLLSILVALLVWQTSFTFGSFGPNSAETTLVLWAVSTLIFILAVTLGFMLTRTAVKLYVEQRSNREGSRLQTKLVVGALALSALPVAFFVVYSLAVLNRNLDKWFSRPAVEISRTLQRIQSGLEAEEKEEALAKARYLSLRPEVRSYLATGLRPAAELEAACRESQIEQAVIEGQGGQRWALCEQPSSSRVPPVSAEVPVSLESGGTARLILRSRPPLDLTVQQAELEKSVREYDNLRANRRNIRYTHFLQLLLITLFILYVGSWIAIFFSRQISRPIMALLGAAEEVRRGNLAHRVHVRANDELASLVRAFNEMTHDLEANSRELERRRRFTEAILESIPSGVISLSAEGHILRVNNALRNILPPEKVAHAGRLTDLFPLEDATEIRYMMNRARRTGIAATQMELVTDHHVLHLSVTVSALENGINSGFVLVLEDTSELLRAQKAAAWQEVARRLAHEIKNPLTPIALCAERIARQLDKPATPEVARIVRECSALISQEVESVRALVDEFSQFSRLPTAQPAVAELNDVVENALAVFAGRLPGIALEKRLADDLPPVWIDREQFKRIVVNLVDNAAEAMEDAVVKRLSVTTWAAGPETVAIEVADTGHGVSPEDREKLFLPYFSTKNRGTGLGLAIVSHIVAEHHAEIRVEDNRPIGTRFVIELPTLAAAEAEGRPPAVSMA